MALKLRRYSNRAPSTTLDGAISATATSLTITGGSGWPETPFTIEIEGEVLLVTDVSGLNWTVERAFDDSVPAAVHPDASVVKHVLVADDVRYRWQDVIVDRPYGSLDDEFDDNDDSGMATVQPSGTTSWTEANGVLSAVTKSQSSADCCARVYTLSTLAIGSGVQTAVRMMADDNYVMAGPLFSSGGTTTDSVVWQMPYQQNSGIPVISLRSGTFANIGTTHYSDAFGMIGGWLHMRLVWVGINQFRAWYSLDGVGWTDFNKGVFAITGINPPTRFGVGVSSWGGTTDKLATFEYLRIWTP